MRNRCIRACRSLGIVVALALLPGCAGPAAAPSDDPAVWELAPGQSLTASSRTFTAIVYRTDCSSGQQGAPQAPQIRTGSDTVTITMRMKPHIDSGTCQGTPGVLYRMHLGEPIGTRTLVDGQCRPGSGDASTSFCLQDGIRLTWRHGHPHRHASLVW